MNDNRQHRLTLSCAVMLLLVCMIPTAAGFDVDRPQVVDAYVGDATNLMRAAALEGINELLEVRTNIANSFGLTAGTVSTFDGGGFDFFFGPSIAILNTIDAGAEIDLIGSTDLTNTLLNITTSFSTSFALSIGPAGGIIDTNEFDFSVSGAITADGPLLKRGGGTLNLSGTNVWNVAPVIAEGTLRGPVAALQTSIDALGNSLSPPGVTIHFEQSVNADYNHTILHPANLVKSEGGILTLTQGNNLGSGATTILGGTIALQDNATIGSGALQIDGGAALDLSASTLSSALIVGTLTGAGNIDLQGHSMISISRIDSTFDGMISDGGNFGFTSDNHSTLSFTGQITANLYITRGTVAFTGDGTGVQSGSVFLNNGVFDISAANGDREIAMLNNLVGAGLSPVRGGSVVLGSNSLTLGRSDASGKYDGTFTGTGDLIKLGDGTLELNGNSAQTYSGNVIIDGGRLRARTFSLGANVINNATLELFHPDNEALPLTAYSGVISGSGKLEKTGKGVVWMRGNNTYSGGTLISDGVLLGNTDTLQGDIDNRDALGFYQIEDGIFGDTITGSGSVFVFGPGRLALTGDNTYAGGTFFSGKLRVDDVANLGASESDLAFVGGTLTLGGAITSRHRIFVATQGGNLDVGEHDFSVIGSLAGPGSWRKSGRGRLRITGAHPGFTGTVDIVEGSAALAASFPGNIVIRPAGILEVAVGEGQTNLVQLDGAQSTATVTGATVAVHATTDALPERSRQTLIRANAGINGTFSSVSIDLPGFDAVLGYTDSEVLLGIVRSGVTYSGAAIIPAHQNVARILDGMAVAPTPQSRLALDTLQLLTTEEIPLALESIAGSSIAGLTRSVDRVRASVSQLLQQRLTSLSTTSRFTSQRANGASPTFAAATLSTGLAGGDIDPVYRHGAWVRGLGGTGDLEVSSFAGSQSLRFGGLAAGYDWAVSEALTAGLILAISESTIRQDAPASNTNVDTWQLGAYARWLGQQFYIDGNVSYLNHDYNLRRTLDLGPITQQTQAKFDGDGWSVNAEAGYMIRGAFSLEPYLGLLFHENNTDAYSETGAGAIGITATKSDEASITSQLGVRMDVPLTTTTALDVTPYLYSAWSHEFTGDGVVNASLIGDPANLNLLIRGVRQSRDTALVGAGVRMAGEQLQIHLGFDAQISSTHDVYSAHAGIRYQW